MREIAKHISKMFSNLRKASLLMRYTELPLSAQTAYAESFEQARTFELSHALAGLTGSFHKLTRKNQEYWYFAYRELDQRVRMVYVASMCFGAAIRQDTFKQATCPSITSCIGAGLLGCGTETFSHD